MKREYKEGALFLSLLYLTLVFIMPHTGHDSDLGYWKKWAAFIYENGLNNVYESDTNYNPFYLYVLYVYSHLQGSVESIHQNIYILKWITLLFDFAAAVLTLFLIKSDRFNLKYPFLLLFNIAYLYNTVIWGQADSIYTFFIFLSFLLAIKHKLVLSGLAFILAINMKLQSIVFLPGWLLIITPVLIQQEFRKNIAKIFISAIILQLIILLPFISGNGIRKIIDVNFNSVDFYPVVSMNAFNIWSLFLEGDLMQISDKILFLGLSYKHWGLVLFFLFSAIILIPFLISLIIQILRKEIIVLDSSLIFLSCALIALVFFYFNTQMHERYSHPAVLFTGVFALLSGNYLLYILCSIAYFLNMERVLQSLHWNNYGTLIFNEKFISILYLCTILIGIFLLYKYWFRSMNSLKNLNSVWKFQ